MLYCTNKMALPPSKTNKTIWFYWYLKLKPPFLLYCTKKTNHFMQKCCTVPKKPKKPMFLDQWPEARLAGTRIQGHCSRNIVFFCFFGTVQHFCMKWLVFLLQYIKNDVLSFKNKQNHTVLLIFQAGRATLFVQYNKNGAWSYKNQ